MPRIYGKAFAAAYSDGWQWFSRAMQPLLEKIVAQHCPQARTWLDLCCGAGALLEWVARAGYEAWGLDASPHQLAHARRTAPAARLVRADVRDFRLGRPGERSARLLYVCRKG